MPEWTRTKPSLSSENKTKPVELSHVPPDNENQEQNAADSGQLETSTVTVGPLWERADQVYKPHLFWGKAGS